MKNINDLIMIFLEGRVLRGCTDNLDPNVIQNCDDDEVCKICKSDDCNGGLFPHSRLFCHVCNDETDCANERNGIL